MQKALARGYMPSVKHLLEKEDYEVLPYRCGIPSTTPFSQAGILYGDNSEIPAFRWWDKQAGLLVEFGAISTFKHVAHKYFQGCRSLAAGGVCIAACYPAGGAVNSYLGYRTLDTALPGLFADRPRLLLSWAVSSFRLAGWLTNGIWQIFKGNRDYILARLRGRRAEPVYVVSDMLEEIFLHHVTRRAVIEAMGHDYPSIYGAFYAYDETAHAYGPESEYAFRILKHVDHTIQHIAGNRPPSARRFSTRTESNGSGGRRRREYELVLLSDHGQIATLPFDKVYGRHLGEILAEWLPTYVIEEYRGKHLTPGGAIDGHIALAYSGGLAHMYFKDISSRLERLEIEGRFPGLIKRIACLPGIDFAMVRDHDNAAIVYADGDLALKPGGKLTREARTFLARFDDPDIVAAQLLRLNHFERAGDLILFGKYEDGQQVNFEHQVGGHGSLGGEQLHPFVMARRVWDLRTEGTLGAHDLHPLLMRMHEELVN